MAPVARVCGRWAWVPAPARIPTLAVTLVVIGIFAVRPAAVDARWVTRAPMQEARQEVSVAALSGEVYVAGGFRQDGSTVATVEVYEIAADRWRFAEPLPVPLDHAAAAVAGGKLYVLGGFLGGAAADVTLEYDPTTNRWTAKAPMPTPRGALAAAVIEGKIYAVGGARSGSSVGDLAAYDPGQDRWQPLPPMPTARDHLGAGAIGGRLYVVGGRNQGTLTLDALEAFDPPSGAWSRRAPMPTGRSGIGAAVVGDRLFVFGGEGNARDPRGIFREVQAYDPAADTWTSEPPMLTPRHGIGAAGQLADIYIPGGATVQGFGVTDTHEVFRVEPTGIVITLAGCQVCAPGDRFAVDVHVANGSGAPLSVEVKVGVRAPDGTPRSVLPSRHLELTLPRGELGPFRVVDLPLPAGLQPGQWQIEGALLEPELGQTLVRESWPFTVLP